MLRRVMVAAAAAGLLAGCGATTGQGGQRGSGVAPTSPSPSSSPVAQAAPGGMWRGIAVYWPDNPQDSAQTVRAKSDRILGYITGLGGNAVSLSFPFFTPGLDASSVHAGTKTPDPARVAEFVQEAHARGVRVTLRPLLDESNLRQHGWRGAIQPGDPGAWFTSYRRFLAPYLAMAQKQHVEQFTVGAELNTMETKPGFAALVQWARGLYRGQLGYSQDWSTFPNHLALPKVDVHGVDAYFNTTLPDDATQQQVTAAWEHWFAHAGTGRELDLRHVVLSEVGIAAQDGAYRDPFKWSDPSVPLNTTVQTRWFTAACTFARSHHMAGIYFWKLSFHADPARPRAGAGKDHGAFIGRPAEQAIRRCFAHP